MSDSEIANLEWRVVEAAVRLFDIGGVVDSEWDADNATAYCNLGYWFIMNFRMARKLNRPI